MEFDNVIVIINQNPTKDEDKRLYYVGMTRAKNELSILRHGANSLNRESSANYIFDDNKYPQNNKLVMLIMGLEDIQLGFHNNNPSEILAGESIGFEMRGKAKTFSS